MKWTRGRFLPDMSSSPARRRKRVYRSPPPLLAIGFVLVGGALILLEIYLVQQVLAGEIRGKLAAIPWILPILIGFFLIRGIANLLNPIIVAVYPHGFSYQRGKQARLLHVGADHDVLELSPVPPRYVELLQVLGDVATMGWSSPSRAAA